MKKHVLLIALAAGLFAACKKENAPSQEDRGLTAGTVVTPCTGSATAFLPSVISGNRTLFNDTIYVLDQKCWVKNGTLTIEPGTVIKGNKKTTAAAATALIITRDATINAVGTSSCPIIFTSNVAVPAPGDWGGLVIMGDAPISTPSGEAQIEGIDPLGVPAGVDYLYGGSAASDNSGSLRYVRVEYAGAVIEEGNELNGITLGGVGCGTTVDHLAILYGADDGLEIFGGNVNIKYVLSAANNDDQFDFDYGYKGAIQFAVAIIDRGVVYAPNNSNGIECDGGLVSNFRTRPLLSNFTIMGPENCTVSTANQLLNAARFRVDTRFVVRNSIFANYPTGIRLDDAGTIAAFSNNNADNCSSDTTKSFFFDNIVSTCNSANAFVNMTPHSSTVYTTEALIQLVDPTPASFLDYFNGGAIPLYPASAPAVGGTEFCGLGPVKCTFTFDSNDLKGGAVDPAGNYWLAESWVTVK